MYQKQRFIYFVCKMTDVAGAVVWWHDNLTDYVSSTSLSEIDSNLFRMFLLFSRKQTVIIL